MITSVRSPVVVKTWTDLTSEAQRMGVLIGDKEFDGTQCGEYDPDTRTAFIDPTMSVEQRVCTLQHELIHARHFDDGLRLLSREKEECLTRKETALALINPVEYMHAEDLYGGEPYAMAQELGITVGVLLDYQRWLHDNLAARAA
ncbi:hypothetical protein MCC01990_10730 [Bifidobacteriaceae bacterium MCC01990]|jgi:hypothetical protein|uniref:IrrE N-terminal-like domain-containing protein n=1 Tax=Bifidobacterium longum subsp. longum TaxID=1679 RepID=A0A4R0U2N8_BIFLL|nr:hypothetical protein MCC10076_0966 [Bifidobacterium longum subsp. longum]GDZ66917.1 hypothetical protein MCC01986_17790 [Bifidobacteriaceae bacterium MCC01986]GDZ71424.1 hypothetical protein MCC01984_04910 [Bifidobacteriaceae bacterium MCC01984]GDZ77963.1 hypothetical protein MCC01990_10730 [Bifidobacteriaceae bacterium MCC01990]